MKMRVASWNILNDWAAPWHKKQVDRLDELAEKISVVRGNSASFLIYLCEIVAPAHAEYLARHAGLVALGEPTAYLATSELGVYLADPETSHIAKPRVITINEAPNKLIGAKVAGVDIIGCHMPYRPIRDAGLREQYTDTILDSMPDILVGDLNALRFFTMRRRLRRAGYIEAHRGDPPIFPNECYKGVNNPWFFPGISIDAIHHLDHIRSLGATYEYSPASDHPIISFDIETN